MPPNSKGRPTQLTSIKNPATINKTYLVLSLMTFQRITLIPNRDIFKLHPWSHPVPFIGFERGRSSRERNRKAIRSLRDAYDFVGRQITEPHPGHPPPPAEQNLSKDSERLVAIQTEQRGKMTIGAINEWLYHHGPDYDDRRAGEFFEPTKFEQNRDKLEKCVALVCEQISMANDQCGKQILLPLSLQLTGAVAKEYVTPTLYLERWTYDHRGAASKAGGHDKRNKTNLVIKAF
ncbi:uncharacterized protein TRUGW13939_06689 [Talaromyces rugulosus]|uniref:Uncharacterized protein n=1 Tax=Talaromyces rugulosus TaxID=121627 RepID=A0A7H8QZI3_TALRU|nr:uncharacterized protein TRUGW13939_06689 [Talaromyces rugulosus]QKX59554.1 hypothetical protein TRUGW13939_06689 [Talaromyces rugulosus]